jgi:cell division protein FtsZ
MTINLTIPDIQELKPRITVFGCGGAGGNAVNNMIESGLDGVDFVVANTDAQALALSKAQRIIQLGVGVTEGLGAGSHPEVGRAAAEESWDEINDHLSGSHMVFITAGMGGGTGTGAAPVVARAAREQGILTVGVVTKPFNFEGNRRARLAEDGIDELHRHVDTLIVIPNQNLFRVANEKTTFADAFAMADQVLFSGVACITDLMVKEGLINLDFADVRAVMRGMGKAMMGTGEASGEDRARHAAEAAIANPLLDDVSMHGARGLLISITGGPDLTLYEVDEAASRIREEVDVDANIILGATYDPNLNGTIRVSVVATGTDATMVQAMEPPKPNASRTPLSVKRHVPAERSVIPQAPVTRSRLPLPRPLLPTSRPSPTATRTTASWSSPMCLRPKQLLSRKRLRWCRSSRFPASMCPLMLPVPTVSAACRVPRNCRLLRAGHRKGKNVTTPSRATRGPCSSASPPMSG